MSIQPTRAISREQLREVATDFSSKCESVVTFINRVSHFLLRGIEDIECAEPAGQLCCYRVVGSSKARTYFFQNTILPKILELPALFAAHNKILQLEDALKPLDTMVSELFQRIQNEAYPQTILESFGLYTTEIANSFSSVTSQRHIAHCQLHKYQALIDRFLESFFWLREDYYDLNQALNDSELPEYPGMYTFGHLRAVYRIGFSTEQCKRNYSLFNGILRLNAKYLFLISHAEVFKHYILERTYQMNASTENMGVPKNITLLRKVDDVRRALLDSLEAGRNSFVMKFAEPDAGQRNQDPFLNIAPLTVSPIKATGGAPITYVHQQEPTYEASAPLMEEEGKRVFSGIEEEDNEEAALLQPEGGNEDSVSAKENACTSSFTDSTHQGVECLSEAPPLPSFQLLTAQKIPDKAKRIHRKQNTMAEQMC